MGYELDKLMRQFGVNSPSLTYGGAQVGTPNFQPDKAAFDQYASKYMDQMGNGAMYAQPQFGQVPNNTPMLAQPTYAASSAPTPMPTMPPPALTQTGGQPQHDVGNIGDPLTDLNMRFGGINAPLIPHQDYVDLGGGSFRRYEDYDNVQQFARGGLAEMAGRYEEGGEVVPNPFLGDDVAPAQLPPTIAQPAAPEKMDMQSMLAKYMTPTSAYGDELKTARATASKETEAFNAMLQRAMENQPDTAPSKAEMYFRLAAAFGAPTRSGNFGESLGKVGEAMGQYSKETREAARNKAATTLQLGLQGQQARMQGAKDDLTTLRTLTGDEMKDKRALVAELLKEKAKMTDPQSPAGKQALDEGKVPGTPSYQARVSEIAKETVNKLDAQILALTAAASAAKGNLDVAKEKLRLAKESSKKLTPKEFDLKKETEDSLASAQQAMSDLKRAFNLNPHTFDSSLPDMAQYKLLSNAGSKDKKVQYTDELQNILAKGALSQLKTTFPGAISNSEREALMALQGATAKSIGARDVIIKNGINALKTVEARHKKRLNEINSGAYRDTTQSAGDE